MHNQKPRWSEMDSEVEEELEDEESKHKSNLRALLTKAQRHY